MSSSFLHFISIICSVPTCYCNGYRVYRCLLTRACFVVSSPEDHKILETEYKRNPKPDKTVRANIAGQVSLGEKEVQVCFFTTQCADSMTAANSCLRPTTGLVSKSTPK